MLQSIEKLIAEIEKNKSKSIHLKDNEYFTKYVLIGYDIHGRNWSRNVKLKTALDKDGNIHTNITEQKIAELRGYDEKYLTNAKRNQFREKLLRMGAMYLSDSLYLLPLKVVRDEKQNELDITGAEEFLEAWGQDQDVNLHVMGFELKSKRSIENISKVFKQTLTDRFEEMETHLESAHNKLLDLADEVASDPKKTLRGIHRIVSAMEDQIEDASQLINRYSENEDEEKKHRFNLAKLNSLRKDIVDAHDRIVALKESQK